MLKLQQVDHPEKSVWLVGDRFIIGSAGDCDLVLGMPGVREHHAEITIDGESLKVWSLEGRCEVNQIELEDPRVLEIDDVLKLAEVELRVFDPKQRPRIAESSGEQTERRDRDSFGSGWLLQSEHPKLTKRYPINRKQVIGRATDCDIIIPYKGLSRHHAEFSLQDGALVLRDLNSSNGSSVNGERVDTAVLKFGDRVELANLPFVVLAPPQEVDKTELLPSVDLATTVRQEQELEQSYATEITDRSPVATCEENATNDDLRNPPRGISGLGIAATVVGSVLLAMLLWLFSGF